MANPLPGWYPDPGGQPGMFRYWTGSAWSESLSPTPQAPPPPIRLSSQASQPGYGSYGGYGGQTQTVAPAKSKRSAGPILGLVALVLAVAVAVWYVLTYVVGGDSDDGPNDTPAGNPTTTVCPPMPEEPLPTKDHPSDGRVHGGRLSYPTLGSPWDGVKPDDRLPFGADVSEQSYTVHPFYAGLSSWVASVLVGELRAGDGFYSPEEGSEIVFRCIKGTFYGDAEVEQHDIRNEALTLDGYEGWVVETNLTFDIPNLPTKSEWVVVIIVATSAESASIFYSSVPEDSPEQIFHDTRSAIAELQVDP
ncbi:MAG: DUF2510 domain-containing protein [Propionibacteriaceae bacterium]|nr:DUF2510 domain-containing protein [Propionibacteriaceae bacterium]